MYPIKNTQKQAKAVVAAEVKCMNSVTIVTIAATIDIPAKTKTQNAKGGISNILLNCFFSNKISSFVFFLSRTFV